MKTILLVDNDRGVLEVIQQLLEDKDFRVLTATSGLTALAIASEERPDLIITENSELGISLMDFFRSLRTNLHTEFVPVLILSASTSSPAWTEREQRGAISKPVSIQSLLAAINTALANQRQMRSE